MKKDIMIISILNHKKVFDFLAFNDRLNGCAIVKQPLIM